MFEQDVDTVSCSFFLLCFVALGQLHGCMGEIDLGQQTFQLQADAQGALQLEDCLAERGEGECVRYPNPAGCDSMAIQVSADGPSRPVCFRSKGGSVQHKELDQAPIVCRPITAHGCSRCLDIYGTLLTDSCAAGVVDSLSAVRPQGPPVLRTLDPRRVVLEPRMQREPGVEWQTALGRYGEALNEILAAEGLAISYPLDPTVAGEGLESFEGFSTQLMQGLCAGTDDMEPLTDSGQQGFCSIREDGARVCHCAALASAATRMTCGLVGLTSADPRPLAALWREMGKTVSWLMSAGESLICSGSPIVLDLNGDDFRFSSPDRGVSFDLSGRGSVQTGWIRGDDALLVLDRNANGLIDDGSELFGDALGLDGKPSSNGFRALALLDRAAHGGNENDKVDAGDSLYAQLRLWNDENRDGVSQPSELRPLAEVGVAELSLVSTYQSANFDEYGNHLALQGSFLKKDGTTGKMVDVWFIYRPINPLTAGIAFSSVASRDHR